MGVKRGWVLARVQRRRVAARLASSVADRRIEFGYGPLVGEEEVDREEDVARPLEGSGLAAGSISTPLDSVSPCYVSGEGGGGWAAVGSDAIARPGPAGKTITDGV